MSTPLQCCICGCELSDESFVASHIEGGEHPRSSARLDMKSAMWLWRSNAYYEDTEWMFCPDKSCVEEWKNGSEVKHKLNSYIITKRKPTPHASMNGYVSMTTKDYTQKQMEDIYCEVLVAGLPESIPQLAVGKLAEEHGAVESVHIEDNTGMAAISFKNGQDAEQFWLTCNNASLPKETVGDCDGPLSVEFLWFLPYQNPHLYDDLFGSKATRQLLRAVPRKQVFSKKVIPSLGKTEREAIFSSFKNHVTHLRQTKDHKETLKALKSNTISADVMVMRNWLIYKYNDISYLSKAKRLLEMTNSDLTKAMSLIEYSHVDAVTRPRSTTENSPLASRTLLDVLFYSFTAVAPYLTIHTFFLSILSIITLLLLINVIGQQTAVVE